MLLKDFSSWGNLFSKIKYKKEENPIQKIWKSAVLFRVNNKQNIKPSTAVEDGKADEIIIVMCGGVFFSMMLFIA